MRPGIETPLVSRRPPPALPPGHLPITLRAPGLSRVKSCPVIKPVTLIGSRRDCDFSIAHPDVSKVHCVLVHTGGAAFVCDLRSRCGTFVNDGFAQLSELQPGASLRVGSVAIEVEFGAADAVAKAWAAALDAPSLRLHGETEHVIAQSAAVIGRRNTCDVTIDAPDVSLAHALLLMLDGRPALCDLGSRSGTHLNGEQVSLAWLCDGDEIRIGARQWRVDWQGPTGCEPDAQHNAILEPAAAALTHGEIASEAARASAFRTQPATDKDWARAFAAGAGEADASAPGSSAAAIPLPGGTYRLGDIGRTIEQLAAQLRRSRSATEARAAELHAWQRELERRQTELHVREQMLAAREDGERANHQKIEQFKAALNLAQQLFQHDESKPGRRATTDSANGSAERGRLPPARKPLFETVGVSASHNGNGHYAPAGARIQAFGPADGLTGTFYN